MRSMFSTSMYVGIVTHTRTLAPLVQARGPAGARGTLAIAKSTGVVGRMWLVMKRWLSSIPDPTPDVPEPSIRYTTGNAFS
jgi:hypothetical protein